MLTYWLALLDGSAEHLIMKINLVVWADEEKSVEIILRQSSKCLYALNLLGLLFSSSNYQNQYSTGRQNCNGEGEKISQGMDLETLVQTAKNPESTYLCIFFITWNTVSCFTSCQTK